MHYVNGYWPITHAMQCRFHLSSGLFCDPVFVCIWSRLTTPYEHIEVFYLARLSRVTDRNFIILVFFLYFFKRHVANFFCISNGNDSSISSQGDTQYFVEGSDLISGKTWNSFVIKEIWLRDNSRCKFSRFGVSKILKNSMIYYLCFCSYF